MLKGIIFVSEYIKPNFKKEKKHRLFVFEKYQKNCIENHVYQKICFRHVLTHLGSVYTSYPAFAVKME